MRRRDVISLLGGATAWPLAARAQSGNFRRIGFMGNSTAELEANLVGPFRDGLRAFGYEEGRNIQIEYRWANGEYDQFPKLVAELLAAKVEVIVTAGTPRPMLAAFCAVTMDRCPFAAHISARAKMITRTISV